MMAHSRSENPPQVKGKWFDHKVSIELFTEDDDTGEPKSVGKEVVVCIGGRLAFDRGRPVVIGGEPEIEWVGGWDGAVDPVDCPKCCLEPKL